MRSRPRKPDIYAELIHGPEEGTVVEQLGVGRAELTHSLNRNQVQYPVLFELLNSFKSDIGYLTCLLGE